MKFQFSTFFKLEKFSEEKYLEIKFISKENTEQKKNLKFSQEKHQRKLGLPDYLIFFQGHFVFQEIRWTTFMGVRRGGKTPHGNWD